MPEVSTAPARWRAWLRGGVLWLGLAGAVGGLVHLVGGGGIKITWQAGPVVAMLLLQSIAVAASAAAWRAVVAADLGVVLSWRAALAHLGLLLVGKYVPGKVFGLVARAAALPGTAPGRALSSTLLEQWLLVGTGAAVAAAWLALPWGVPVALVALAAAVLALAATTRLVLPRLGSALRRWRGVAPPPRTPSLGAAAFGRPLACQLVSWLMVIGVAAFAAALLAPELGAAARLRLGLGYAAAVVAGMLAFIVPGGVGVREAAFVGIAAEGLGVAGAASLALLLRVWFSTWDIALGGWAALASRAGGRAP